MKAEDWYRLQRSYYDDSPHRHLQAEAGGVFAENIVDHVAAAVELRKGQRGVEIGCGLGRFTLPLLARGAHLDAVDLSPQQLERLRVELERRRLDPERWALHEGNAEAIDAVLPGRRFDFVVGIFILHHLLDPAAAVRGAFRLLRPGGRAVFLEPNRWNPLYALQNSLCADMSWKNEWRIYRLGSGRLRSMFVEAGFSEVEVDRFGFFPPQVINRFASALALEHALERSRFLRPVLPFVLASGCRTD